MPVVRHALAVLPLAALAAAAAPAGAAEVKTLPCVDYIKDVKTMPVFAGGFAPGHVVALSTITATNPTPVPLTSSPADGIGGFRTSVFPPSFEKPDGNREAFTLVASDTTNPAAPVVVTTPFEVVRFGLTRTPSPKRPRQRVTVTARGFLPGKPVYAHFRFGGITRRTVSLGIAKGPCGITSQRMRALPTKVRYGNWFAYIDQKRTFSKKTPLQWIDSFRIFRR